MAINPKINNYNDIAKLFQSIPQFNPTSKPFLKQRSMTFRNTGSGGMKELFFKGPLRNSKILTPSDNWTINGSSLNTVRDSLSREGLYGIVTYSDREGATIWGLTPDSKWSDRGKEGILEFNDIVESDIRGRRWASAFNAAQRNLESSSAPFSISFIATITFRELPFFGRVAWGIAMKEGVVSIVQIPTMGKSRDRYFSWLFVPNDASLTSTDIENRFGKGGNENDISRFDKARKFLLEECEPANREGKYNQTGEPNLSEKQKPEDNKENKPDNKPEENKSDTENKNIASNPLVDAYNNMNKKESFYRSVVEEACYNAKYYMPEVHLHRPIIEEGYYDDDEDNIGDVKEPYKGEPYENKLQMEAGIPIYGPLY